MVEKVELIWNRSDMNIHDFYAVCKENVGKQIRHKADDEITARSKPGGFFLANVSEMQEIQSLVLTGKDGNLQKQFEKAHSSEDASFDVNGEASVFLFANHIWRKRGFYLTIEDRFENGCCRSTPYEISVSLEMEKKGFVYSDELANFITYK